MRLKQNWAGIMQAEKSHTDEDALVCKICSLSFSRSETRSEHEKSAHGMYRFEEISCETEIGSMVDIVMNGHDDIQCDSDLLMTEEDFESCVPIIGNLITLSDTNSARPQPTEIDPPEEHENEKNNNYQAGQSGTGGREESEEKPTGVEDVTSLDHSYAFMGLHYCKICGKGWTSVSRLKQHEVCHSDERPYLCDKCGKAFKYRQRLTRHNAGGRCPGGGTTLPGILSHICNVCDRAFMLEDSLKQHYLIHTAGRLYKCDQCEFMGVTLACVKKHQESHPSGPSATITSASQVKTYAKAKAVSSEPTVAASVESQKQVSSFAASNQVSTAAVSIQHSAARASYQVSPAAATSTKDNAAEASIRVYPPKVPKKSSLPAPTPKRQAASVTSQTPGPSPKMHYNEAKTYPAPIPPAKPTSQPPKKVAFACKYCKAKFQQKIHAAGHMKMCFARFDMEFQSLPNSQFNQSTSLGVHQPSGERASATRVNRDENLPPSRSPSKPSHIFNRRRSETPPPLLERQVPLHHVQQSSIAEHSKPQKSKKKDHQACKYCGNHYQSHYIEIHERLHTGERPFSCSTCQKVFICQRNLRRHKCNGAQRISIEPPFLLSVKTERVDEDDECRAENNRNKRPERRGQKRRAILADTTTSRGRGYRKTPLTCRFCSYQTRNYGHLKSHECTHTGQKPFACDICGFRAANPEQIFYHKRKDGCKPNKTLITTAKMATMESPSKTASCGQKTSPVSVKTPKLKSGKFYCCVYCQKEFVTSNHLRLHLRFHVDSKPYGCRGCGAQFKSPNLVTQHRPHCTQKLLSKSPEAQSIVVKTEPGTSGEAKRIQNLFAENSKQPSKRGRKPIVKQEIDNHIKLDPENGLNPFGCELCDKTFLTRSGARSHVVRIHLRQNKCDVCGQGFALLSELVDHFPKHVDKKLYGCPKCPVRFSDLSAREMHIAGHGCGDPFLCLLCGEWFRYDLSLKEHIKAHLRKTRSII